MNEIGDIEIGNYVTITSLARWLTGDNDTDTGRRCTNHNEYENRTYRMCCNDDDVGQTQSDGQGWKLFSM